MQARVRRAVADMIGVAEAASRTAADGCGAPVFGLRVRAMASAFARLAAPAALAPGRPRAVRAIVAAMTAQPDRVGGPGRFDTVPTAGLRGRGIARKVADRAARAAGPAALRMFAAVGVLGEGERRALAPYREPGLRTVAGDAVGGIRTESSLRKVAQRVA